MHKLVEINGFVVGQYTHNKDPTLLGQILLQLNGILQVKFEYKILKTDMKLIPDKDLKSPHPSKSSKFLNLPTTQFNLTLQPLTSSDLIKIKSQSKITILTLKQSIPLL